MSSKRQLRFGNKGSLSVEISDAKAGLWYDHESGEGGDLFSLIMREQGCGFIDVKKFAQDFVGTHCGIWHTWRCRTTVAATASDAAAITHLRRARQ